MYWENCDTVLPMKKQTMVASRKESGISGPALRAMIGNVNTMLVAGAMCVTPWNTSSGRPSELRRNLGSVVSAVNQGVSFNGVARATDGRPEGRENSQTGRSRGPGEAE